jgi:hypothetical protein
VSIPWTSAGIRGALALSIVALLVGACAPTATEDRQISSFTSVSASSGVEVRVVVGGDPSARVTGTQGALDNVTVRVEGGRLQVSFDGSGRKPTVEVTTPSLLAIDASSSAKVTVEGVSSERFDVNVSSQAKVEASGTTGVLWLNASSQSEAKLGDLAAQTVSVNISSQSTAEVQASGAVTGDVSSQSRLTITGSTTSVNVATSSQGEVVRR